MGKLNLSEIPNEVLEPISKADVGWVVGFLQQTSLFDVNAVQLILEAGMQALREEMEDRYAENTFDAAKNADADELISSMFGDLFSNTVDVSMENSTPDDSFEDDPVVELQEIPQSVKDAVQEILGNAPAESPDDWVVQSEVPVRYPQDQWCWMPIDKTPAESDWKTYDGGFVFTKHGEKFNHLDGVNLEVLHVRCRRSDLPKPPEIDPEKNQF